MSNVTRHPTIRRVPTSLKNTVIYEVVQTPQNVQAQAIPEITEDRVEEGMEGVEESRETDDIPHVGDKAAAFHLV